MKAKLYKLTANGWKLKKKNKISFNDWIKNTQKLQKQLQQKAVIPNGQHLQYFKAQTDLLNILNTIDKHPYTAQIQEIKKGIQRLEKEKKQFENNYFFKEYEKERKAEIQALKNQLQEAENHAFKIATDLLNKAYKISKEKAHTLPKKLTLNPYFDDQNGQIKTIHKETQTLFISSLEQWENLFSNNIQEFQTPIKLKPNTKISDLRLFLDMLHQKGLIKNSRFNKLLQNVKAFSFNGSIITANQYKDAKQIQNYPNTLNYNKIKGVFNALNVD